MFYVKRGWGGGWTVRVCECGSEPGSWVCASSRAAAGLRPVWRLCREGDPGPAIRPGFSSGSGANMIVQGAFEIGVACDRGGARDREMQVVILGMWRCRAGGVAEQGQGGSVYAKSGHGWGLSLDVTVSCWAESRTCRKIPATRRAAAAYFRAGSPASRFPHRAVPMLPDYSFEITLPRLWRKL